MNFMRFPRHNTPESRPSSGNVCFLCLEVRDVLAGLDRQRPV